jgi:beta-lactamase regulating signal transducer with metallopeptidase domain
MHLPLFDNSYFLQSLGWAIANSFWQAGMLWLLYKLVTISSKNISALIKYHLSLLLLHSAFTWFILTIIANYSLLSGTTSSEIPLVPGWVLHLDSFSKALPFLAVLYFLLLGIYSIRFIRKMIGNYSLKITGLSRAPIDFRLFVNHTASHLGIKGKVQLWMSSNVDVPSVTGFFKPVILLPAALMTNLSLKQVESVLLHELAHIKRNDYLVNLVQATIELLLFFNPFVSLLSKAIAKERENCCDDWVMNFRYDQYDYASALLLLEEQRHLKLSFAMTATNDKKNLLHRIKRLFSTQPQTNLKAHHQFKFLGLCAILVVGFLLALPVLWSSRQVQQSNKTGRIAAQTAIPVPAATTMAMAEKGDKIIIDPLVNTAPTRKLTARKEAKKAPVNKNKSMTEGTFVNALINEELLVPASNLQPLATLVSEKDSVHEEKFYIKIEEEESGENGTQTYIFELENKDGSPDIKPLIMLNKVKVPLKKPLKKRAAQA